MTTMPTDLWENLPFLWDMVLPVEFVVNTVEAEESVSYFFLFSSCFWLLRALGQAALGASSLKFEDLTCSSALPSFHYLSPLFCLIRRPGNKVFASFSLDVDVKNHLVHVKMIHR